MNYPLYPVILFTYNRADLFQETLESLRANHLASETLLYIFSDGPKCNDDKDAVKKVRRLVSDLDGFKEVIPINRDKNYGLASNIIHGLDTILKSHEGAIVLEDDIVTAPFFLNFMNNALHLYRNDESVCQVNGYSFLERYSKKYDLNETYFLEGSDCLAWGTWKRSWSSYTNDSSKLYKEILEKNLKNKLNRNGSYNYLKMLQNNVDGKTKSWAVNWLARNIIDKKYSLFPLKSLALHIGVDERSTNYSFNKYNDPLDVRLFKKDIIPKRIEIKEEIETSLAYKEFLRDLRGDFFFRINFAIKNFFKKFI